MKKLAYILGIFAVLTMSSCTAEELALANELHYTITEETETTVQTAKDGDIDPPKIPPKP